MSQYKKTIEKLFESNITGYQISNATGNSQNVISSITNEKRQIDNLTLGTTEKLYEFQRSYYSKHK
ncbi:hypothetical protein [Staphylococcus pettenkoferi]|uniref:hypothetical protein n=1 Tax=Staphylococcus pettenkoferi TaxID=170573 RepID=UPI00066D7F53|nr:hypothetical protein [Staphylococcus pettenkoferi]MDK7114203.1 hypothetical protein [Staphylococcus pettenkoferi]MDK7282882.1 hypothetical protein [Staphylococcus pettenkoferi]